eukprot:Seg3239.2 transcript_id=Seg3239.2/GoldUCD/mRNA.D3Y31 product="ELAV-like protein 2" protein_id=Seg3239.2/GoldUCD/D3Y31
MMETKHMNGHAENLCSNNQEEYNSDISKTNLIVNYLPQEMTEEELRTLFSSIGPLESCKLIKNKMTRVSLGYAFVNYVNSNDAKRAIDTLGGMKLTTKTIKVSYARPSSNEIKNANLYISGLPLSCTKENLSRIFGRFGDIITCKVLEDDSGGSKGVGFVRFDKRRQAEAAIDALNNKIPELPGAVKPLTVKFANPPSQKLSMDMLASAAQAKGLASCSPAALRSQGLYSPMTAAAAFGSAGLGNYGGGSAFGMNLPANLQPANSISPWCIFVYNLPTTSTELTLFQLFAKHGAIDSVKVITDEEKKCKGFGFVNMVSYEDAYCAILRLNGCCLERGKPLQVSFKKPKNAPIPS